MKQTNNQTTKTWSAEKCNLLMNNLQIIELLQKKIDRSHMLNYATDARKMLDFFPSKTLPGPLIPKDRGAM